MKFCVKLFWSIIGWTFKLFNFGNKNTRQEPIVDEDQGLDSPIISPTPVILRTLPKVSRSKKFSFKLYDVFGSVCYEGDSYEEGIEKAKIRPYTAFMKAFNEDGDFVGVVWASPETKIMVTNINTLIPN